MTSEAAQAARSRLLRSKTAELNGIFISRKRKIREALAVCDHEGPLPNTDLTNPDAPPTNAREAQLLDLTDITQDRLFNEAHLPTRRQMRSYAGRTKSSIRNRTPDANLIDGPRKAPKLQSDGSKSKKSRAPTPNGTSVEGRRTSSTANEWDVCQISTINGTAGDVDQKSAMQRSSSKSSQTDLPAESSAVLNEILGDTLDNTAKLKTHMPDAPVQPDSLERSIMQTRLESRPNTPGVEPRKVMQISTEDAAKLPGPDVQRLGSQENHKPTSAHLPGRQEREHRLLQADRKRREHQSLKDEKARRETLSINLPRENSGNVEATSSPSSTVDAHSATTPAMHEASTDTSPENDNNHYDVDRLETKDDDPLTPLDSRRLEDETTGKDDHDRIPRAQADSSVADIMRGSPGAANKQLLSEEQAAANRLPDQSTTVQDEESPAAHAMESSSQVVKEGDGPRFPVSKKREAEVMSGTEPAIPALKQAAVKQTEIADSEADDQTPDGMDTDNTIVQGSFGSGNAVDNASAAPVAPESVEAASGEASEGKISSLTPISVSAQRTASIPPIPDRMNTRISSGAIRHKSVSEILGETPRPGSESTGHFTSLSRSMTPQTPGARMRLQVEKEKERSKRTAHVIFPQRQQKLASTDTALTPASQDLKDDYFMPLFLATAAVGKKLPSLEALLSTAHKTITTANAYVPLEENQTTKVLKRIYNLQVENKWSLRQPKRSAEPIRPTTHWDVLLQEAKWMRTDFREERKWKAQLAKNLAEECAEWVNSIPEDRKLLQVKVSPKRHGPESNGVDTSDSMSQAHPTPDLVASFDSPMEDFDDEPHLSLTDTIAPALIFSLPEDEIVFGLRRSPASEKLFDNLPMYGAPLAVPQSDLPTSDADPDRAWRRPALPLSKYVEGRMVLRDEGPPRKKSRYEYDDEEDDDYSFVDGQQECRGILPPEKTDVALFNPEHKHTRERIHASHQFRPPSEFAMPLQSFFENRTASQWTYAEDNEIKTLVRQHSYNWSLISSMLSTKSMFASGAERRTPWECFERWVELEGLPSDMQKTQYFRAYTSRIENANRNVMMRSHAAQQNSQSQSQTPHRFRPTTSTRVERRRATKHLALVDAMKKLAKKRETNLQKQLHAANMAAMRKANEAPHAANRPMGHAQTPQEISRIKHERDMAVRDRMLEMQQRQEQARRAALMQARNQSQSSGQHGMPNGGPSRPPGAMPGAGPTSTGQNLTVPGQRARPMPPQMAGQPMPNGLRAPQMTMKGVPQATMQGQMPLPNPSVDVGLVTAAHRISQSQQSLIRQQQGQIPGQSTQMHHSPPRMNGMPQPGFPMQQNMMPQYHPNANGVSTPPVNAQSLPVGQGQAGSPRMNQSLHPPSQPQVQVTLLERQFKLKNPNATPEQLQRMITETLAQHVRSHQQSAMNAAAGGGMIGMNGIGGAQGTPQLYAQMLRQQQQQQQQEQQKQQAQQGQIAAAIGNGQTPGSGNSGQGHAHRGSSGSAQSGK